MNESKPSICRVCLQSGDKYMSLFELLGSFQVYEHILSIAIVSIAPADGLPGWVCPACMLELQAAVKFKNKCEASNRALRTVCFGADATNASQLPVEVKKEEDSCNELVLDEYLETLQNSESDDEVKTTKVNPSKHEKTVVQCDQCQQFFKSKCKLRVHWKKEHMQKTFVCQICRRLFKSLFTFNKHKVTYSRSCSELKTTNTIRVDGEGKSRVFHCTQCEYKSERLIHLRTHVVVHTPGAKPFKCQLCPNAYTQRGSLKQHMDEQHDGSTRPTCHVCGKAVRSRRRLYRHLKVHREATLRCPICNKLLKSKDSLRNHMKRHTGDKEFTCEMCAAAFFTQAELCNHRRLHHAADRRTLKCSRCEFRCARKSQMDTHEVKHTGDKEFPCLKCGRFYESLQHLHIHLVRYHKPKRFKCPTCCKLYSTRKSAKRHMRIQHGSQGSLANQPPLDAGAEGTVQ